MQVIFDIERRASGEAPCRHQRILFETEDQRETVATALQKINDSGTYTDENGERVEPISWEVGCLQKKCGACAMLINGKPQLACDTFLRDILGPGRLKKQEQDSERKACVIMLAPLGKFPVIRDLLTDRSVMFENLKTLKVWSGESAQIKGKNLDRAYDASRCLQCGCCLEVCPNFYPGGAFFSAAGFAPQARLLSTYTKEEQAGIREQYESHIYAGCGKSLACQKVCPAGIDLDRLVSRSNAISIWRRP